MHEGEFHMPEVNPTRARLVELSFKGASGNGLTDAEKAERERLRAQLEAQIAANKASQRE